MGIAATKEDLADQLLDSGRLVGAELIYTQLQRARPRDVVVLTQLAEIALRTMRLQLSVDLMSRAVACSPASAILHHKLGVARRYAGQTSAALESFRAAAKLSPHSIEAAASISIAVEELGNWDDATRSRSYLGLTLPVIHRMRTAFERRVALTVDDGPSPEVTPALLSILDEFGAKASFFLVGSRCAAEPELLSEIVERGHDVLSHGYSHSDFITGRCDPIAELDATEGVLSRFRPTPSPYYIRLPFGAGWFNAALHRRISQWRPDAALAQWGRLFYDWHFPDRCFDPSDLEEVCHGAVEQVLAVPTPSGTVFMMHSLPMDARHPLSPNVAPSLLREFLDTLRSRGYQATSLSRLRDGRRAES